MQNEGFWLRNFKTHGALFMSQGPFGVYVVLARGSVDHISPNVLVLIRFLGGLFWLCVFHAIVNERNMVRSFFALPAKHRWDIGLTGLLAGVGPLLFIYGVKHCSAAIAAVVEASMPAIAVVLSLVMRTEKLTLTNALCVLLSLAGNYFVLQVWEFREHGVSKSAEAAQNSVVFGAVLCFGSAALSVINSMLQRPLLKAMPPEDFITYMLGIGVWVVAIFAAQDPGAFRVLLDKQPLLTWAMVSYALVLQGWLQSFFSALAVARSSPVMYSMYAALIPAISSSLGYLLLGETLTHWQIFGAVLVVASVIVSAVQFDGSGGGGHAH